MVYCEWKQENDLVEGLFSWGSSNETINKSHTENIRDTLNESINKTMMSTKTSMSNTVDASQDIDLDFTECSKQFAPIYQELVKGNNEGKIQCITAVAPDKEAMASCGEVYKLPPSKEITPCRADNIKQDMKMTFDASKSLTQEDTTNVQKNLREDLESRINDENDALGSAVQSIASAASSFGDIGSSSSSTNDHTVINKTKIVDRVVNMVDKKFISDMSTKMAGNQSLKLKDGSASFITQSMSLDLVAKMTDKNASFKSLMNDIERVDKKIIEKKNKGVTDAIETGADLGKEVSNVFGDVATTGMEETGSTARTLMIAGVIIAVVAMGVFLWFLLSPAGQSVAETAADTGSSIAKAKTGVQ